MEGLTQVCGILASSISSKVAVIRPDEHWVDCLDVTFWKHIYPQPSLLMRQAVDATKQTKWAYLSFKKLETNQVILDLSSVSICRVLISNKSICLSLFMSVIYKIYTHCHANLTSLDIILLMRQCIDWNIIIIDYCMNGHMSLWFYLGWAINKISLSITNLASNDVCSGLTASVARLTRSCCN